MKISFGRYLAIKSPIHNLDPRLKLLSVFLVIISIFFPTGFFGYSVIALFILTVFFLARIPFLLLINLFRSVLFLFFFLLILGCFIIKTKEGIIWKYGIFTLSQKAIFSGLYITLRIYLMIITTTILTTTTKPLDLTLGIEDLLKPLKLFYFPIHIISTIISIALRSIPTLFDEANRILKAQASRGVDLRNSHFREKIKALISLIIPLLVSAFQKAEELAYAMDARGYDPQGTRTRFRQYQIRWNDCCFFILTVALLTFIIILYADPQLIPLTFPIDKYVKN